jgi:hypothetical protein
MPRFTSNLPEDRWRYTLPATVWLGMVALGLWHGPVSQDPGYHLFAADSSVAGIPNFWNTISNLPFALVGAVGLWLCRRKVPAGGLPELLACYRLYFAALILITAGSAWYHLAPDNSRLLWDRLPMAAAFMALFSALLGESLSPKLGRTLLWPLVALGVGSVCYWYVTELQGHGDLRPYLLVQLTPMLLIPFALLLFGSRCQPTGYIWWMLLLYALALVLDRFDTEVASVLSIGGHPLKHLVAALAAACLLPALRYRYRLPNAPARIRSTGPSDSSTATRPAE